MMHRRSEPQTRPQHTWAQSLRRTLGALSAWAAIAVAGAGPVHAAEMDSILLNAGAIDTSTAAAQALRADVDEFSGKRLHLVQFSGPIQQAWVDALAADGLQTVSYIPNYSYLVWGDYAAIARMQARAANASAAIRWEAAWRDEYKLHTNVWASLAEIEQPLEQRVAAGNRFDLQLVADSVANAATLRKLAALGGTVTVKSGALSGYVNYVIELPPTALAEFAAQVDIVSIHRYFEPTLNDERQDMLLAGNMTGNAPNTGNYFNILSGWGFTPTQFSTSGFAVDVTDDGADINPAGGILTNAVSGPVLANHFTFFDSGLRPIGAAAPTGTSRYVYKGRFGTAGSDAGLGNNGHGQLNMNIVGGYVPTGVRAGVNFGVAPHADASAFRYGLGVAPYVRLANSVIFDSAFTNPNNATMLSTGYANNARISSNSWGAPVGGVYNAASQTYDGLVRDSQSGTAGLQPMIVVFSAGNSGAGATTIGSPGTGKNVITVGAAENVQAFGGADGCGIGDSGADSANDIISFSSRGPCTDGRAKPEIVGPGTHVSGIGFVTPTSVLNATAQPGYRGSGVCGGVGMVPFPAGQNWYTASSGTSHSCPAVAGGAALVYQQFINNPPYLAAARTPASGPPSPALTKAYLMNTARYMTGTGAAGNLWSNSQGMGMMNLGMGFDRTPRFIRDEVAADAFTASAQTRTFNGSVSDPTKPFRVTLAYSDAPGPTAGNAYVNNLDLSVTVGGSTYLGNVFTGANSVTGGTADVRNNAESVFLPAGVTGPYSVTVTATNIAGQGNPTVVGNNQDFALVVYNSGPTSTCPAITVTPATMPAGAPGTVYATQTLGASGGASPYTFNISGGALPAGLNLAAGAVSGTPGAEGTFIFTATATDTNSCTGSTTYTLPIVCPPITVLPATVPSNVVAGVAYPTQTFSASGGTPPYTFSALGTLPPGLTLVGNSLQGTPTTAGTYNFSIAGTGNNSCVGTQAYTVVVIAANLQLGARTITTGNFLIEPNECNSMNVVLNNIGSNAATAVSSTLSTSTPGVTISVANSAYPNLPATSGTGSNTTPFQISTTNAVVCYSNVSLSQTVNFTGGASPQVFNYLIPVGQAGNNYVYGATSAATIDATPKTLVAGSTGDDVVATVATPFAFSVYGTAVASGQTVTLSSNGNLQIVASGGATSFTNAALPATAFGAAVPVIMPYWDDLRTDTPAATSGVFQSVTGVAPNRVWNIEWRGTTFTGANVINFELRLFEGSSAFTTVYNNSAAALGQSATIGVQPANSGAIFTQFSLNTASVTAGTQLPATLPPGVCNPGPASCDLIFRNGFD